MRISVVIPVYNAADYVRQAVESALTQPETAEVILAEDGSTDNSLAVCQELAAGCSKVHLCLHPDSGNHGAGAARNLGILESRHKYIAFLDADDFFLPNRFAVAREIFQADDEVDGVYEAIAMYVENEDGARRWAAASRPWDKLHTMTERVTPDQLFAVLVRGGSGSFSIDGLVVKRSVFDRTGLLDEHLRLHQDSAILVKMAAVAKLVPGRLDEPVAMWRIHDRNRISEPRLPSQVYKDKLSFWDTLLRWSRQNLDEERQHIVLDCLLRYAMYGPRLNKTYPLWLRNFTKRIQFVLLLSDYPSLIRERAFWKRLFPSPQYWLHRLRTWLT
jgi:glycosyltransferase involved in cell wall biosynthesis